MATKKKTAGVKFYAHKLRTGAPDGFPWEIRADFNGKAQVLARARTKKAAEARAEVFAELHAEGRLPQTAGVL